MRRWLVVLAVVVSGLASADMMVVRRATPVPPTANILDENFNPAGYVDGDWTEPGTPDPDEDSTTCGAITGFSGQCLRANAVAFDAMYSKNAFAAESGALYLSLVLDLAFTFDTDGDTVAIVALSDADSAEHGLEVYANRVNATDRTLILRSCRHSDSFCTTLDTVAFTDGAGVCLELLTNYTTGAWSWKVAGVTEGSNSSGGISDVNPPTNFYLGAVVVGGTTDTIDIQFDSVKVGNTGFLGCP